MCEKNSCGRIIMLDELASQAESIRNELLSAYKSAAPLMPNFVTAQGICICCFHRKRLYIADCNFRPVLGYESNSFICACSVSNDIRYAVFQMAHNNIGDADSGATAILDIRAKRIIARKALPTGFNGTRSIFIDSDKRDISVYIADSISEKNYVVKYDFDLKADDITLQHYYTKADISPYALNSRLNSLIDSIRSGERSFDYTESEIVRLVERLKANLDMSHYQLALTLKNLGDLYCSYGKAEKAITAYETGLLLYPDLSVKRNIKMLKKKFPDIKIPKPYVYSLEREKAWEKDDYTLPSTYAETTKQTIKTKDYRQLETYKRLCDADKAVADMMYNISKEVGEAFIDGLKTDGYRFMKSINNLDSMSDQDFNKLFNKLCSNLDEPIRKEARRIAEKRAEKRNDKGECGGFSAREEILLDMYAMTKSFKGMDLNDVQL